MGTQVEKALSSNKPCEASALASSAVKNAYMRATGATPEKIKGAAAADPAPPDEECPICYEDFKVCTASHLTAGANVAGGRRS